VAGDVPEVTSAAQGAACAVGCNAEAAAYAAAAADHAAEVAERTARATESAAQANLLRDIVGDPFRPLPPIEPSLLTWNSNLVRTLAQAAYDNRLLPSGELDPARLAVLADALTDAGCTETELLEHLRGEGPHLRGCYGVDLLLGRK
jgi:hypothetical protein